MLFTKKPDTIASSMNIDAKMILISEFIFWFVEYTTFAHFDNVIEKP